MTWRQTRAFDLDLIVADDPLEPTVEVVLAHRSEAFQRGTGVALYVFIETPLHVYGRSI